MAVENYHDPLKNRGIIRGFANVQMKILIRKLTKRRSCRVILYFHCNLLRMDARLSDYYYCFVQKKIPSARYSRENVEWRRDCYSWWLFTVMPKVVIMLCMFLVIVVQHSSCRKLCKSIICTAHNDQTLNRSTTCVLRFVFRNFCLGLYAERLNVASFYR